MVLKNNNPSPIDQINDAIDEINNSHLTTEIPDDIFDSLFNQQDR